MRRFAGIIAWAIMVFAAAPAFASGEIVCEGDNISVDMSVGRLPVLSIFRVVVNIGDKTWSSDQEVTPGTPIAVGQRFEDQQQLLVDFTDDNVETIIARLRAFALEDGDDYVSAGVFSMAGEGVFIVDCSLRG